MQSKSKGRPGNNEPGPRSKAMREKYGQSAAEQPAAKAVPVVNPATLEEAIAKLRTVGPVYVSPVVLDELEISSEIVKALLAAGTVTAHPKFSDNVRLVAESIPAPAQEPQEETPKTEMEEDLPFEEDPEPEPAKVAESPAPSPPPSAQPQSTEVGEWDGDNAYAIVPEHEEEGRDGDLVNIGILTKLDQDSGEHLMYGDGGDGDPVPEDLWIVEGIRWAWLKYEDKKIVERIPYGNGVPKPAREDLDPPPPERGRDCWADTPYGLMTGVKSGLTIVVTGSGVSMQNAFKRLTRMVRTKREMTGLAVKPMIELHCKEVPGKPGFDDYWVPRYPARDWLRPDGMRLSGRPARDEDNGEI